MCLLTYCTLPKILAGLQTSLGGNLLESDACFSTKSGRLCISIRSPIAFLSTQQPFLVFGEGQVNFPTERLQQVLNFSNGGGLISDNQFASRSYYSIHLRQDRRQFAPAQEKSHAGSSSIHGKEAQKKHRNRGIQFFYLFFNFEKRWSACSRS